MRRGIPYRGWTSYPSGSQNLLARFFEARFHGHSGLEGVFELGDMSLALAEIDVCA